MTSQQFGPYVLESLLGVGGMGEVHRAHDTRRDRRVALKLLPPPPTTSAWPGSAGSSRSPPA